MSWPMPWQRLTAPQCDALRMQFPGAFGLLGFPGSMFRVSTTFSYIGYDGSLVVYTEIWSTKDGWIAFAKGSAAELEREICLPPE